MAMIPVDRDNMDAAQADYNRRARQFAPKGIAIGLVLILLGLILTIV